MALDDPGALCVTAALAPTVASRLEEEEDAEDNGVERAQLARHPGTALRSCECGKKEKTTCAVLAPPPISFPSPHLTPPPKFLDLALSPVSAISCTVCAWISVGLRSCERMFLHVVSPL